MEIRDMKEVLKDIDYELTLTSKDSPWDGWATRLQRVVDELRGRGQTAYYDAQAEVDKHEATEVAKAEAQAEAEDRANQERNEQAIVDGEARYRQSVLGDELQS